jgi:3-isopropylmalate/(R)-2-methylmalate dehydratase large subunit
MTQPKTLYAKIWDAHVVHQDPGGPAILYIDRHLIHEVTSPQAFAGLKSRGLNVRRPDFTTATEDHSIPTTDRRLPIADEAARHQLETLRQNCQEQQITFFDVSSGYQGIVHVIGPEQGLTQPGMTIVCGDSHTSTHGAFGALAFGIGTSEVELVLATQCLLQAPSKTMEIRVEGQLLPGVTAKDLILYIISKIGVAGATGHVIEYTGSVIRSLSMEGRMTLCNMSIEAGARAGLVAPDEITFDYLRGKPYAPQGANFEVTCQHWRQLKTDDGAVYDKQVILQAEDIEPMVTFGTHPGMAMKITEMLPTLTQGTSEQERQELASALEYMQLPPGQPIAGTPVDVVFIGSCTNARIEDLRAAATVLKNRRVSETVRTLVVPGSYLVKKQAESEGLSEIFKTAGCEWREPGCSMCIAMNGDIVPPGKACASTSNRNFKGRQGKGSRTFLLSPAMAAAAAITGKLVDVRTLEN